MTFTTNSLEAAEGNLKEARHQKWLLRKKLNTLKVMDDVPLRQVDELQEEINELEGEAIPALEQCLAYERVQCMLVQLGSENAPLMTEDELRAEAAEMAHRFRLELQRGLRKRQDNSTKVLQFINALQGSPYVSDDDIQVVSPWEAVVYGKKYSATSEGDLHFLAQRAITLTWPNSSQA